MKDNWIEIAVFKKDMLSDENLLKTANLSGIGKLTKLIVGQIYYVRGVNREEVKKLAPFIFYNPLVDHVFYDQIPQWQDQIIVIEYLPGVMNPVKQTVEKVLKEYLDGNIAINTRKIFLISGKFNRSLLVSRILSNPLIEREAALNTPVIELTNVPRNEIKPVPITDLNSEELKELSVKMMLSLNVQEMNEIQRYFKEIKREPNQAELETIAQTWSEHCVHKTFKGTFNYNSETITNLLKSTIVCATEKISRQDCLSVFKDNAGIVRIDDQLAYCVKVETHNHPSALEPYGGAGTGLGGVIRDILGTGKGAKPVAGIDVFCTGNPHVDYESLPSGVLHPRRILTGVIEGVRDYGNRVGLPTVAGALIVDSAYTFNPLVFAGCVGIIPVKDSYKQAAPGDKIVLIGGRTGRDGLHGATFSSLSLDVDSEKTSSGAVQIGNPIEEKKVIDAVIKIRDKNLIQAITDCGAGGLSSAVGEMGEKMGATVHLELVPLKYQAIQPWEIWLSESQERMVLAVKPEHLAEVEKICSLEQTEAVVIGEFTDNKRLQVYYQDQEIVDLPMDFLHEALPPKKVTAKSREVEIKEYYPSNLNLENSLVELFSYLDIASKQWIIREYDHQVQGKTIQTPFSGEKQKAPADGVSIKSDYQLDQNIVIGLGININLGKLDSYKMAYFSVEEALRNLVCGGGDPSKAVLLDNFSWGSVEDAYSMGDLVKAARGCHDAAINYQTPFISGKDSFNNTYQDGEKLISIPPTLLITAVSTSCKLPPGTVFSENSEDIWLIGPFKPGLGGSYLEKTLQQGPTFLPEIDPALSKLIIRRIYDNLESFRCLHDISDGGLLVCLAEMLMTTGLGAEVVIDSPYDLEQFLFSESPSRFVCSFINNKVPSALIDLPLIRLGRTDDSGLIKITHHHKTCKIEVSKVEQCYFRDKI
ncbi:MAG: hypothetical protein APR63_00170 [Desulfuromonas sp. SDB]|nr:MAG: hypothetical protein APR63_00170 [Desulfuromonas sp. SDB]